MTVSIQTDDNGRIKTIYRGERSGSEWTQVSDSDWPEVTESNVSVERYWDGSAVTVETEPIPEDDTLL